MAFPAAAIDRLQGLLKRIDRERINAFARFVWLRFLDDRCFEAAGALAYTTMFALVPMTVVSFGALSAFPVFEVWTAKLTDFVFSNFVPGSARAVERYLFDFAAHSREMSLPIVLGLVASLLLTMWNIERTFNRIWRVPSPRPQLLRFLMYWTLMTLGSMLAAATFAGAAALSSLPLMAGAQAQGLAAVLLEWLPSLMILAMTTLAYWLIPHRSVPFRFALAGGLLATVLFAALRNGLVLNLRQVSFEELYGALAVLPLFLVWIYLCWVVVLLGASLAASLSSFRYQPAAWRLPPGSELYGYLRLIGRLQACRAAGIGLHQAEILQCEPMLAEDFLQKILQDLLRLRVVQRGEGGGWLLSRDLESITLRELYEALALRVPTESQRLPGSEDAIGQAALRAIEYLREPLQEPLGGRLSRFFKA
jgi:membrane protein